MKKKGHPRYRDKKGGAPKMPKTNGGPAVWKCQCAECNCENATPKIQNYHEDIEAVCYFCAHGDHRTPRVRTLEQEITNLRDRLTAMTTGRDQYAGDLEKAKDQITKLERMKGIQWKH